MTANSRQTRDFSCVTMFSMHVFIFFNGHELRNNFYVSELIKGKTEYVSFSVLLQEFTHLSESFLLAGADMLIVVFANSSKAMWHTLVHHLAV